MPYRWGVLNPIFDCSTHGGFWVENIVDSITYSILISVAIKRLGVG